MASPVLGFQRASTQEQPFVTQLSPDTHAFAQTWSVQDPAPNSRIGSLAQRYVLATEEVARLYRVLREWPRDLVDRGLTEELEDILAARKLDRLKPLTVDDFVAIRVAIALREQGPAS